MTSSARHGIGVDIGGTKILARPVDLDTGTVGPVARADTPRVGGAELLAAVVDTVERAIALAPGPPLAIGVGTAGVVVDDVVVSANALLPGWADQPLADTLRRRTGLPVTVRNDVHAAALAEVRFGAAAGASRALVVAVGTGIGGALVLDGAVTDGPHGIAGSIGHVPVPGGVNTRPGAARVCACGALDHLEAWAGGRSLEDRWHELTGERTTLGALAARLAEPEVRAHVVEAATLVGRALAGAAALLDLDVLVLGGGVVGVGPVWGHAVRQAVRDTAMRADLAPDVRLATLGNDAALVGAALAAAAALSPPILSPAAARRSAS